MIAAKVLPNGDLKLTAGTEARQVLTYCHRANGYCSTMATERRTKVFVIYTLAQ